MRIAIHATAEAGLRAARILLGEPSLQRLGYVAHVPRFIDDSRAGPARSLHGFDVLVTDDTDNPADAAERALDAGIACVLWSDLWHDPQDADDLGAAFEEEGLALLAGSSVGTGIASVLARHEVARTEEALELTVAWTVPGRKLRKGEAIPFPAPVGALWARRVDDDHPPAPERTARFIAPVDGDWAGAMVRVTGIIGDGVGRRVVGVADHAGHLEGLALATGAVCVAGGFLAPGLHWPMDLAEDYLRIALEAGLDVATFTPETSRDRI